MIMILLPFKVILCLLSQGLFWNHEILLDMVEKSKVKLFWLHINYRENNLIDYNSREGKNE